MEVWRATFLMHLRWMKYWRSCSGRDEVWRDLEVFGPLANTGKVSLLGARGNGHELEILGEGIKAGIIGYFFLNITVSD